MANPVSRRVVEAFFRAYSSRDPRRIARFLADDVEWLISGPIDLLPFCGQRRGKAAVLQIFERLIPDVFRVTDVVREDLLVDGERIAVIGRILAVQHDTGRTISYRVAQFLRFRRNKVVACRSIIDSFDAAEQVLGHQIPLMPEAPEREPAARGDLVAV